MTKNTRMSLLGLLMLVLALTAMPSIAKAQEKPGLTNSTQIYTSLDRSIALTTKISAGNESILNKCDEIRELIKSLRWTARRNPRKKPA